MTHQKIACVGILMSLFLSACGWKEQQSQAQLSTSISIPLSALASPTTSSESLSDKEVFPQNLVGTWVWNSSYGPLILWLESDGSYTQINNIHSSGGCSYIEIKGGARVDRSTLVRIPQSTNFSTSCNDPQNSLQPTTGAPQVSEYMLSADGLTLRLTDQTGSTDWQRQQP